MIKKEEVLPLIKLAFDEDIKDGDHSSLSCIPNNKMGKAQLIVKDQGIIAGIELAEWIFESIDPSLFMEIKMKDGDKVKKGDIAFTVKGYSISILTAERLVLNCMQRMSAIATKTRDYVELVKGTKTTILDTRKTTPGIRVLEKWAVKIGGGDNHRFGLYDMIMLKDNHIDYAGGITKAIDKAKKYLKEKNLNLKIEVEARDLNEVKEIMTTIGVHRIMLDNFTPKDTIEAVKLINGKFETESSGGITSSTIRTYAECGVDFISVGALTHSIYNMDLSLKAY
ncbi:carboxylating nicotinate-nucleotide diphosphorylase [Flavobacteriales bacterium]|nr:carboxylating nicotinate-nucleotide diphosphorylase [Flavobacteriales bacterium]MDG1145234.1 carboxylating nicotinate-nucleotide diphosphorylase [Flavobacteriales bacterium]MDG1395186.1 carboxylating nicotinate-nucleotide diphosphorylase [Flavobacteriales bacterium]